MVFVYALTSVLSAFLVFFIQPVVAKVALPTLGGTPLVWNGCMLFFQATLLSGYIYAHLLTRKVPRKAQLLVHLLVLAGALAAFPIAFAGGAEFDPVFQPLGWLLATLFYSVGLPFFAISASSPLLQRWFSHTGHKDAANPYFLYAAGNAGSMGALLLYPVAIEPFVSVLAQVRLWETGVTVLAVGFLSVALFNLRHWKREEAPAVATVKAGEPVAVSGGWEEKAKWLFLSFIPASLLYGVTTYVTTDIASVPLLWIIPLTLYLLTFIVAFSNWLPGRKTALRRQELIVVVLLLLLAAGANGYTLVLALHMVGFYFVALAMHSLLAYSKPAASRLTGFFLWVSLGGVLGGIFNTLVAPYLFNSILEYPLVLVFSLLVRKSWRETRTAIATQWKAIGLFFLTTALVVVAARAVYSRGDVAIIGENLDTIRMIVMIGLIWLLFSASRRYQKQLGLFAICLSAVAIAMSQVKDTHQEELLFHERSVYGVYKVQAQKPALHLLTHGTTLHGVQSFDEGNELRPRSYYSRLEGVIAAAGPKNAERPVMAIGLGAGTMACYGKAGQRFDFYEIDPLVEQIARDEALFTYLRDCPADVRVILGDGRMKLNEQPDGTYGVIFVDAFSSDAIPMHLLTRESVGMYMQKLAEGGVLALHISNRHINLLPVVSAIAEDLGVDVRFRRLVPTPEEEKAYVTQSIWAVMSADKGAIATLDAAGDWQAAAQYDRDRYLWRDDFSNIFFSLVPLQELLAKLSPSE